MKVIELSQNSKELLAKFISSVSIEHELPEFDLEGKKYYLNKIETDIDYCFESEDGKYIAVLNDNEIIGICGFSKKGHIAQLFVRTDMQSKGIGKLLLSEATLQCRANEITVNASINAVSYYQKQGFLARNQEINSNGVLYVPMAKSNS